jgi:hypothetical protein
MTPLSQAEIDATQASRRKKEAAGGGHPSLQGKNLGVYQQVTDPRNWEYSGSPGKAVKGFFDPAGLFLNRHDTQQIETDPKAAVNPYTAAVAEAIAGAKGLRGLSPANIRARQELDAIAGMSKAAVRRGGPLGVAAGLGATGRAQVGTTKASAGEILNDVTKMTDLLTGAYGDEEQYKWIRALEESRRLGTISAINLGLLNDAKARMAQKISTAGVMGAQGYAAWEKGAEKRSATEELRREKELDEVDQFYGIGDSDSGTSTPGEWDL